MEKKTMLISFLCTIRQDCCFQCLNSQNHKRSLVVLWTYAAPQHVEYLRGPTEYTCRRQSGIITRRPDPTNAPVWYICLFGYTATGGLISSHYGRSSHCARALRHQGPGYIHSNWWLYRVAWFHIQHQKQTATGSTLNTAAPSPTSNNVRWKRRRGAWSISNRRYLSCVGTLYLRKTVADNGLDYRSTAWLSGSDAADRCGERVLGIWNKLLGEIAAEQTL